MATELFDAGLRVRVLADLCWSGGGQGAHEAGLTVLRRTLGNAAVVAGGGVQDRA